MTLQTLIDALSAVCADTYPIAAPAGLTRCVVATEYGAVTLPADDAVQLDVPRVQIDVFWQSAADTLEADVKAALSSLPITWETIERGYDDQYALMRLILQAVLC